MRATTHALETAWNDLQDALLPGWFVGTPVYHVERREWALYAYDTTERALIDKRNREWTALGPTEADAIREMARCLAEIAAGRVPR